MLSNQLALLTAAGTILGTAAYMSPEQAAGKEANAQSDIFSFGIVLYEMLCGRRPFNGTTSAEVMADILKAQPEPPHRLRAGISEPLERIVLKCLQRNPESRYASGAELEQDLEKLVKVPETGRFLAVRAALLTAAVLIAVIGSYYGWQSYRRRSDLRWLEETAVPEITNLLQHDRALEALRLYRKAERIVARLETAVQVRRGRRRTPHKICNDASRREGLCVRLYGGSGRQSLHPWLIYVRPSGANKLAHPEFLDFRSSEFTISDSDLDFPRGAL